MSNPSQSGAKDKFRSPLGRVRGLGSAKNGVGHWWAQRVTAVALIPLLIWFVASIVGLTGADHGTVVAWIGQPLVSILLLLLLLTGFYHLRLGLQVAIEDYIHDEGAKVAALLFVTFAAAGLGLACVYSVFRIGFGG